MKKWPDNFNDRLHLWYDLRQQVSDIELEACLTTINSWWQQVPWKPYYLHWDDQEFWPNPWQLLNDNYYCDLARALGIVYTLLMIERPDITDIKIADSDQGNLVLVNNGKYILNWGSNDVLNISPRNIIVNKLLDSSKLIHFLG